MCFLDFLNNCFEFFFLRLIYRILMIDTCNRTVGRNLNNVHAVNITELFFLRQSRTGHTSFLLKFIEEVLECNGCKCLALSLNLYMPRNPDRGTSDNVHGAQGSHYAGSPGSPDLPGYQYGKISQPFPHPAVSDSPVCPFHLR